MPLMKLFNLLLFQVWHEAPADLQRSLYEHFFELLTESRYEKNKDNAKNKHLA